MARFRKRILVVAMILVPACAASVMAQEPLQWDLVTDNLLADVDLSEIRPIDLLDIHFFDDKTGLIGVHDGQVIRTDDGGVSWHLFYKDDGTGEVHKDGSVTGYFNEGGYYFFTKDIWFSVPRHGAATWARTLDAGRHWEFFENKKCPDIIPFFLSANVGWGTTVSSICATKDGGKTWSVVVQNPGGFNSFGSIFMLDDTHGWVAADRQMLATTDGSHWLPQFQEPSMGVLEMHFFDRNNGFSRMKVYGSRAGRLAQKILHSNDGGQHWVPSTWNGSAAVGAPQGLSNCTTQGNNVWVIGSSNKIQAMGQAAGTTQYDFILFHSRDGAGSFESVGKLPDNVGRPKSIAIAAQNGKPVLLMLDANGALWQIFLPGV